MFAEYTQWPRIKPETAQKVQGFLEAGNTSLDLDLLEAFEADLGRYFNVSHALLTNNGTSAAFSAFHCLRLEPEAEIIAPCYTHWATVIPATLVGQRIVFADVEPTSLSMSVEAIQKKITDRTKAVVVCHLYGNPVNIQAIRELCDQHGLYLVEDISHAPGASMNGTKVGSFGDVAFLSFQASKMISGGEGGALLTKSFDFYARAIELAHPKRIFRLPIEYQTYNRVGLGYKFRLPAISALLAYASFQELDETIAIRREMFAQLWAAVSDIPGLDLPTRSTETERVHFRWEFFLPEEAREIVKTFKSQGIRAEPANYEFLPDLPHFRGKINPDEPFPNARRLLKRLILFNPFTVRSPAGMADFATLFRNIVLKEDRHG